MSRRSRERRKDPLSERARTSMAVRCSWHDCSLRLVRLSHVANASQSDATAWTEQWS